MSHGRDCRGREILMFTTRKCSVLQKTQPFKKYCEVAKVGIHICLVLLDFKLDIGAFRKISHNCNLIVHMNAICKQMHCALKQLLYEKNATSINCQMI